MIFRNYHSSSSLIRNALWLRPLRYDLQRMRREWQFICCSVGLANLLRSPVRNLNAGGIPSDRHMCCCCSPPNGNSCISPGLCRCCALSSRPLAAADCAAQLILSSKSSLLQSVGDWQFDPLFNGFAMGRFMFCWGWKYLRKKSQTQWKAKSGVDQWLDLLMRRFLRDLPGQSVEYNGFHLPTR